MFQESEVIRLDYTIIADLDFVCNLENKEENASFIIPWSRAYKKQGFHVEGTLRECIWNGKAYESLTVMSILRREYESSRTFS